MNIVTLNEAPHLEGAMWDMEDAWPSYMLEDPIADLYYGDLGRWTDRVLLAVDDGEVVAKSFRIAFAMGDGIGRPRVPDRGWDAVILWAHADRVAGRAPTHTSLLEITVRPDRTGEGIATRMIRAAADAARREGFDVLYAPVRPSGKPADPATPMAEYLHRTRPDGLPVDAWVRTHVRLGAEIVAVCPTAMTISGTLEEWRRWTGLPFDRSGPVEVPGALVPVHVSVEHDHAVYVEPNVWMRHPL